MKDKNKSFYGWSAGRFHINFDNGNHLSTVWGEGTYSDEHDSMAETRYLLGETRERPTFSSNCVEIMFDCPKELKKEILDKYNEGSADPIGYLELKEWIEIVNLLNK